MYIAFDTETTGIHENSNILTAYFEILDYNLNIIDSLYLKIKWEYYTVYPRALEVNKIDLLKHNSDTSSLFIKDANNKLVVFLSKYNRLIPIGHNVNFDSSFIKSNLLLSEKQFNKYISFNVIDTIIIAQFLKMSGRIDNSIGLSLNSLCKFFNIQLEIGTELHNAKTDTKMTIELLRVFRNTANEKEFNKKRKRID